MSGGLEPNLSHTEKNMYSIVLYPVFYEYKKTGFNLNNCTFLYLLKPVYIKCDKKLFSSVMYMY